MLAPEVCLPESPTLYRGEQLWTPLYPDIATVSAKLQAYKTFGWESEAPVAPTVYSEYLSEVAGCNVWVKNEGQSPVGSFKSRGSLYRMLQLSEEEKAAGVTILSSGNAAQGAAWAGQILGTKVTAFMHQLVPEEKVDAVSRLGAEVNTDAADLEDARNKLAEFRRQYPNMADVAPYDHIDVVLGQGTVMHEALQEVPDVTHVFSGAGGGGLCAGTALALEQAGSNATMVSVQPNNVGALRASMQAGRPTAVKLGGTIAEGARVAQPGLVPFNILHNNSRVQTDLVSEQEIVRATVELHDKAGFRSEPTGALGAAALRHFEFRPTDNVVVFVTGSNISDERLETLRRAA